MGVGEAVADSKKVTSALADLAQIAGQKPVVTKARKSIATFKLRENMPIGGKVTLRRTRMYEFLDRLVNVALPRVRDFRGLNPKSFDGRGNYALGIKEHIIFPEINYDEVDEIWGMDVIVCTTAQDRRRGARAAEGVQFPVPAVAGRSTRTRPMAKKSSIEKNNRRRKMVARLRRQARRAEGDRQRREPDAWRSASRRASSSPSCRATRRPVRIRNRCEVTGRPRGYYRKLRMSRIALRDLGSAGLIPGLVKSSW